MSKNYYQERDLSCIKRTEEIVETLPYYVLDFFIGVELRTSSLTRLNYAYDLRIFYNFLAKKVFRDKKVDEITLSDLSKLDASDFEYFFTVIAAWDKNSRAIIAACQCRLYSKSSTQQYRQVEKSAAQTDKQQQYKLQLHLTQLSY